MRLKYVDCTPLNSLSKPPFRKHQTSQPRIEASLIRIYIKKEIIILRASVTKVKTFPSYCQAHLYEDLPSQESITLKIPKIF